MSLNDIYNTLWMNFDINVSKISSHLHIQGIPTTQWAPMLWSSWTIWLLMTVIANFVYTLCHQCYTYRQKRRCFILNEWYVIESVNWCQHKIECTDCNMEIKPATFIKIKRAAKRACLTNTWGNVILHSIHFWVHINKTEPDNSFNILLWQRCICILQLKCKLPETTVKLN